ncbi:response regulator FixJ [Posidoniimonas corsicana]|uniref:Response regulator FixJ n=2 Tax=Posidoniimonas corsicana TaxID=1938618 RepID=A0A5C5V5N2_9BACT|nr:response regulator FixJ [Posidoniimonas corsicana]
MPEFSKREIALLDILVGGASSRVAAAKMGLALRTIELHRRKVMDKLGAATPVQLGFKYAAWKRRNQPGPRVIPGDGAGDGGAPKRL